MNQDYLEVESLVIDFIMDHQALNQCIQDEQRFISANDFHSLEQSYFKKNQIHKTINQTIHKLQSRLNPLVSYGDLFVKLSYYAGTLDSRNQATLLNLIQRLRETYKAGLQLEQSHRSISNVQNASSSSNPFGD